MDATSQAPLLEDLERRTTITVPQAAAYIGIGRSAAYEAARRGDLPTLRIGRRLLVPVPQLIRLLYGETIPPASTPHRGRRTPSANSANEPTGST